MPAPKGHPLWGNPLNPKLYDPETLWLAACEYFEWCNQNPCEKQDFIKGGEFAGQIVKLKIERPYSIEGMCNHLNITRETFDNYSKKEGYETFFYTCKCIRQIIDSQHFEGGMVGAFNANIVTRKLGLVEKAEIEAHVNQKTVIKWGDKELEV